MGDLTYLMNVDRGSNAFYGLAKQYFVAAKATVIDPPPAGQTLEGVFKHLADTKKEQKVVNLVSHATGIASMQCAITNAQRNQGKTWIDVDDLQDALATSSVKAPGPTVITPNTRIVIYGCDIGRTSKFLKHLLLLFGDQGELLAPRRMSIFKLAGSKVVYRQAQSWSLARKEPLIPAGKTEPTVGWPKFRETFVTEAVAKFGAAALAASGGLGDEELKRKLTTVASTATIVLAPTFFISEDFPITPAAGQTPAAAAASIKPASNGDPITTKATSPDQVDDTTVVTTVTAADTYAADAAKTKFTITLVILAKLIEEEVAIAEGAGYRRITCCEGKAPSPGPKPTSGGSGHGPSAFAEELRALLDELHADGASQADLDAMLAAVPQGDATEEIVTEVPDEPPMPDDLDSLALPPEEVA